MQNIHELTFQSVETYYPQINHENESQIFYVSNVGRPFDYIFYLFTFWSSIIRVVFSLKTYDSKVGRFLTNQIVYKPTVIW